MKYFVWALLLTLIVLHQDYWQWNRTDTVLGFIPYPLAFHMSISIATTVVWVLVVKFCWPAGDDLQDELDDKPGATK